MTDRHTGRYINRKRRYLNGQRKGRKEEGAKNISNILNNPDMGGKNRPNILTCSRHASCNQLPPPHSRHPLLLGEIIWHEHRVHGFTNVAELRERQKEWRRWREKQKRKKESESRSHLGVSAATGKGGKEQYMYSTVA